MDVAVAIDMTNYNITGIYDEINDGARVSSEAKTLSAPIDGLLPGAPLRVVAEREELGSMRDEQLMERIAEQDNKAFEEIYSRYVRGCFGLAMKIVSDPTVAEEVVQDVFAKLWSQPYIFAPERGKFSGWLLTLVHNRSVDRLRRLKSSSARTILPLDGNSDTDLSLADMLADGAPGPYEEAWSSEKGAIVRQALSRLPGPQREALTLAYFSGLTQREIADRLQEPLGTIKTRTRSALHQLRQVLAGQGLLGEV